MKCKRKLHRETTPAPIFIQRIPLDASTTAPHTTSSTTQITTPNTTPKTESNTTSIETEKC